MAKQDEQRLLVKIATLYYLEGRKQSDIAQLLSLSQSFVSRAITRCQKEGVVKISVVQPSNIFLKLEKGLEDRYGLKQAVVVDTEEEASDHTIKRAIGSAAAHYLETRLRPKDLIGVSSWSSTIRAMVDEVHAQNLKASGVIQLLGGVGPNGNVQATILTQTLAQRLNCDAWLLPSQSIEGSMEERNRLLASKDVADVVSRFDEVDIAIVGIGILEPSQLLKTSGNYYHEDMLQVLAARGAVGDICLHYYDKNGHPVLQHFEEALESAIALAFFIPLLIGTGGNSGTQITSTLVRSMALGEVRLRDMGRVIRKEVSTSLLIAITLGLAGCLRAWMMGIGMEITLIVSLTLVCITLWSAVVSSVIPLTLKRLGIDPAVVSAPFIATLIDGTGLIIYFKIAQYFLGLN